MAMIDVADLKRRSLTDQSTYVGHPMDPCEEGFKEKAAEWREQWLSGFTFGKTYDVEAREKAVVWVLNWMFESLEYFLNGFWVGPFCTEMVLEALQMHGGKQILPMKIDGLEDITLGIGGGFSGCGEVCGAVSGHIIAIGMDIASRTRETALIRKEVQIATRRFCKIFKEKFGSLRCCELTGTHFLQDDAINLNFEAFAGYMKETPGKPSAFQRSSLQTIPFCIYAPLPSEQG